MLISSAKYRTIPHASAVTLSLGLIDNPASAASTCVLALFISANLRGLTGPAWSDMVLVDAPDRHAQIMRILNHRTICVVAWESMNDRGDRNTIRTTILDELLAANIDIVARTYPSHPC